MRLHQYLTSHFIYNLGASFPLLFFLVAFALCTLLFRRVRLPDVIWKLLAFGAPLYLLAILTAYLCVPVLFEDGESSVASLGWLAFRGLPLYPALNSPAPYAMLYGPITFLIKVPFYYFFGSSLVAAKLPGCIAPILTLVCIYKTSGLYGSRREAMIATGAVALVLIRFAGPSYSIKNDPLLLAGVAVAVLATLSARPPIFMALTMLAFATLPNLKITACTYLIPVLGLIVLKRGWRMATIVVSGALLLMLSPFLLSNVSLPNYVAVLRMVVKHSVSIDFFVRNVQYSILFLLPLAWLLWNAARLGHTLSTPLRIYLGLILLAMVIMWIPAAKPGSGPYHLLPFLPPIVHAFFWVRSELPEGQRDAGGYRYALPLMATAVFYSTVSSLYLWNTLGSADKARAALTEIRETEKEFRNQTVELGYGDDQADRVTWYRYQTTFDGQPYTLDSVQVADAQFGGVGLPDATIGYIESCRTRVWLIPAGKEPFTLVNGFFGSDHPLFDDRFRQAFLSHYRLKERGTVFDRWIAVDDRCNAR